jgi:hypothetical protein
MQKTLFELEYIQKKNYYTLNKFIFETAELRPNNKIFSFLVNGPFFFLAESFLIYSLFFKQRQNILFKFAIFNTKVMIKFGLFSLLNMELFLRNSINEVVWDYKESKLDAFLLSLTNPIFGLQKDKVFLLLISIPCYLFNSNELLSIYKKYGKMPESQPTISDTKLQESPKKGAFLMDPSKQLISNSTDISPTKEENISPPTNISSGRFL